MLKLREKIEINMRLDLFEMKVNLNSNQSQ